MTTSSSPRAAGSRGAAAPPPPSTPPRLALSQPSHATSTNPCFSWFAGPSSACLALSAAAARRGWRAAASAAGAGLIWVALGSEELAALFEGLLPLAPRQLVNHFPGQEQTTRKDLLLRNLRRAEKQHHHQDRAHVSHPPRPRSAGRRASSMGAGGSGGGGAHGQAAAAINSWAMPDAFLLPDELGAFLEAFHNQGAEGAAWVLEACDSGGGGGGGSPLLGGEGGPWLLTTATTQGPAGGGPSARKGAPVQPAGGAATALSLAGLRGPHVASRKLDAPLLVGGRTVELRLFAQVASADPLLAYVSDQGLVTFASHAPAGGPQHPSKTVRLDDGSLARLASYGQQQGPRAGGGPADGPSGPKWGLPDLHLHIEALRGHDAAEGLERALKALVRHVLEAAAPAVGHHPNAFELLGFDFAVDNELRPRLLQVVASPSLAAAAAAERSVALRLASDVLDAVVATGSPWEGDGSGGLLSSGGAGSSRSGGSGGSGGGGGGDGSASGSPWPEWLSIAAAACGGRQRIGSFELLCNEAASPAWRRRRAAAEELARAAAATTAGTARPAGPAGELALLAGGGRPAASEPPRKVVLRG